MSRSEREALKTVEPDGRKRHHRLISKSETPYGDENGHGSMTRVSVSERVLRWALYRSNNPEAVEQKFPKLAEWLQDQSQPTLRQLEAFARATSTPFGSLFLFEPPEDRLPIPHFRTLGDEPLQRPSPDLLDTVHTMERRQAWMREHLIELSAEPLAYVRSAQPTDEAETVANKMREALSLAEGWAARQPSWTEALRLLQNKMEAAGILVVVNGVVGNNTHRKLNLEEFRGFVLVDEFAPLVFVNGADFKAAQMFTLAHELAHLWFGSSAAFDLRALQPANDKIEQACNSAAAEFLVPAIELHEFWPHVSEDANRFQAISRQFKISEIVAARRALDLGFISKDEFFDFYEVYRARQRRVDDQKPEGGDFYRNQNFRLGRRFGETVIRAAREGELLYREAYQLTGLYGRTFEQYAETLGLGEGM